MLETVVLGSITLWIVNLAWNMKRHPPTKNNIDLGPV